MNTYLNITQQEKYGQEKMRYLISGFARNKLNI